MYRLICLHGKKYSSPRDEIFAGDELSKIYGKLDCPSPQHTAKDCVFFEDEVEALATQYHPCPVCMREHYELWKAGRLMTHALRVELSPFYPGALREDDICTVFLANGVQRQLSTSETPDFPPYSSILAHTNYLIEHVEEGGYSYCWTCISDKMCELEEYQIEGDYCIVTLMDDAGRWGRVIVWDYVQDYVVHLTAAPFARCSTIFKGHVVSMCMAECSGELFNMASPGALNASVDKAGTPNRTLWYGAAPLGTVAPEYEPDLCLLPLSVPDGADDDPNCFDIRAEGGTLVFRAGTAECRLGSL